MRVRKNHQDILVAAVLVLLLSACTPSEPTSKTGTGEWVGTITTEGNVWLFFGRSERWVNASAASGPPARSALLAG